MSDETGGRGTGGESATWKILVVDDEEVVRNLAAACIQHGLGERHQVLQAGDGEEAIAIAERERPDLILLDILMPGMDGIEACRRLKSAAPTKAIPIVFLTALGSDKDVTRGLELGGDAYIVKPFNAVTLTAQISELLSPGGQQPN